MHGDYHNSIVGQFEGALWGQDLTDDKRWKMWKTRAYITGVTDGDVVELEKFLNREIIICDIAH